MKKILAVLFGVLLCASLASADTLFPNSPTTGQVYNFNNTGVLYQYDGAKWLTIGTSSPAITKQIFTASGTYTPSSGMQYAIIECVGSGASGGGVASSSSQGAGGGGGGGSYSRAYVTAAQVGASQTVTVGAAGAAPSAGNNNGNDGADVSVGTLCVGKGGSKGSGAAANTGAAGGAGGVAGTGDVTVPGEAGANGVTASITTDITPVSRGGSAGMQFGAGGKASFPPATGADGSLYGGGGAGGADTGSGGNKAGGAGAKGIVIITEFLQSTWSPTGGVPAQVSKTADQTLNTSTTLASDNALTFPVLASTKYSFRFVVFYDTPTAADFKWQITCPASPTVVLYDGHALAPGATSETITRDNACSSSHSLTETSGTPGSIIIQGIIQNGANAGSVTFQWAQNTSNGSNTTVYAGSNVQYTRTQ